MTDESRVATSRVRTRSAPFLIWAAGGCVIGIGVILAGFFLADWQQTQLQVSENRNLQEHESLIRSLEEARQSAPRSRLEELATLPLLAEFMALSADQPDSLDAKEVGEYLRSALEVAREETGLFRIILQTGEGEPLLLAGESEKGNAEVKGTRLEAAVLDFEGGSLPAGNLIGFLPSVSYGSAVTDQKSGNESGLEKRMSRDVPRMTRYFAVLAGFLIAGTAVLGAFATRRRN